MIALAILLLVVVLIVLLSFQSVTSKRLQRMEAEMAELKKLISKRAVETTQTSAAKPVEEPKPVVPLASKKENYWESGFRITEEIKPVFKKEDWLKEEAPSTPVFPEQKTSQLSEEPIASSRPVVPPQPPRTIEPNKPSFFERNPDLEKFIGENLVSKIGIAILVLAIGYFVKYAIDNEWIGTIGRVGVGIVCGGILIGLAHRLRNNYHAFSSVLAGGGLAVFYFTITIAFQQYHLFSQTAAFVIMLVITMFAVLLALLYNRQELAVIALTGGFAAPFLISTGSGNYITLFVYLIVLNTGLLLIAYRKSWRVLNTTAFAFTVILFASWLYSLPYNEKASVYSNAFLFAFIFYLLFLAINIANNIKENKRFIAFDFSILLANTGLFFSVGLYCLHQMKAEEYNGLFSAAMGVFNLGLSYFLFKKQKLDKNILYLLIGITLTFVSLTAPLQLHGHFITLFWASEAVLLGWLFIKSNIKIIQYAALIVYLCMLLSLVGDWINVYFPIYDTGIKQPLIIIANRGFITGCYVSVMSYVMFVLLNKNNGQLWFVKSSSFRIIALVILFLAGNIEIGYQFAYYYPISDVVFICQQLYSFVFILILLLISKKRKQLAISEKLQTLLLVGCLAAYFVLILSTTNSLYALLWKDNKEPKALFIAHWFVALFTGVFFYRFILLFKSSAPKQKEFFTWLISAAIVVFLSVEIYLLTVQIFYNPEQEELLDRVFTKAVLPVLWGLCSFSFMWFGMKYKYKTLRVISLSLFSLTLLKLFAYDISSMPATGKIIAFFCLGVLLLIISFMYQRLKKIIVEDEAKPKG